MDGIFILKTIKLLWNRTYLGKECTFYELAKISKKGAAQN
jgi:hypothetical protein